jgi:hypothetical protein
MGRDPRYHGKFGIPDFIINTPQKPPQWWLVAMLALMVALPLGMWDILDEAGALAAAGYAALIVLTGLNAWFLRNDINETYPYLWFALASGLILLIASVYMAAFEAIPDEQWLAAVLLIGTALIALHNTYRAWQALLIIGLFTEQKVPPDSPYYKA